MSIFDKAAGDIATKIVEASPDTDKEIVQYFFIRVFNQVVFYSIVLVLTFLLQYKFSVLFTAWISYYLMRRCWGGSHLESEIACLITTIICTLFATWLAMTIRINIFVIVLFYVATFFIVNWTDVVDSPAKRIVKLRAKFRKQGYITLTLLFLVNTIIYFIPEMGLYSNAVVIGVSLEVISLLIGKLTKQ